MRAHDVTVLQEVQDAVVVYEQQRPGRGARFLAELEATLERIREAPLSWRPQFNYRARGRASGGSQDRRKGAPFLYLGEVEFRRAKEAQWKGDRPITVTFDLKEPVPRALWRKLGVRGDALP